MKSPLIVILLLVWLVHTKTPALAADDIFATPAPTPTMVQRYPTAIAFLAATRSGEIPEMLRDKNQNATWVKIGPPLLNIMTKEYGLDIRDYYAADTGFGLMLQNITDHEFDAEDKAPVTAFQNNQKQMPEEGRKAFNKFALLYSTALKEYIASKHQQEAQQQEQSVEQQRQADVKLAEQKHQADLDERTAAEERRKQKELTDAQQASQKAEEDIKDAAVKDALAKAREARQKRLAEVLASPTYKQWEAALVVQQGQEMISNAQRVLDHDDAVQGESGVTDLAARRSAGEQMVAGKTLVETAFEAYRKSGGKAATPSAVVPGTDPAAAYR